MRSERAEKLLERIIETDGIKKIQDAITAVISGTPNVNVTDRAARLLGIVYGSQSQQLLQRATTYALITSPEQTRSYVDFSVTVSGEIIAAPGVGNKLRLFDVYWSSNADIITSLRFGAGGSDMWPLQKTGVMSKNLVGRERDGAENTNLYAYLSGAGTMKGTAGYEIVAV